MSPLSLAGLVGAGVLLGRGAARLRGRARRRAAGLWGGLGALALAESPPVEAAARELFSAHMAQHLVLVVVAAPLLAYARAPRLAYLGLPRAARRRLRPLARRLEPAGRAVGSPWSAWALHTVALWAWHLPGPYQAALAGGWVHLAEHAAFLGTSFLVWARVLERRAPHLGRALLVFATALPSGLLGAILLFAARPLYPAYVGGRGLGPLEDQQLGGVLMWVPPGTVYFVTAAVLVFLGLRRMEPALGDG